jgi:CheY-like chemotaxis protein
MNLAVNARDAMPRGGTLTITATAASIDDTGVHRHPDARNGGYVCLSVTDTGCGIKADILPRIFEPFFTTKLMGKGTGLGLATVYGIVKQLDGWVEVSTEVGKGSTFKVYLPAHGQVGVASAAEAEPKEAFHVGATIFVVEDEDALRELTCEVIRDAGYQVIAAADGVEALKVWKENRSRVDLLFTDIVMPNGISGRELARKLRADKRDLKIFFTSGYSAELIGKDSLLAEGNSFLAKPYSPKALLEAVRQCLSGIHSQFSPALETATMTA